MSLTQLCFSVRRTGAGLRSSPKKEAVGRRGMLADRVLSQSGLRPDGSGHGARCTAEVVRPATSPSASSASHTLGYDPIGRRILKSTPTKTVAYTYDGADILRENVTTSGGLVTSYYVHGPGIDEPLSKETGSSVTYYHADGLGSIAKETDGSGVVTNTLRYDAWGNIETGARDGFAFTGREWDPETALYYYRARYYDPKAGRFISEDPIGFMGGASAFTYVDNRPTDGRDPSGLITFVPARGAGQAGTRAADLADLAPAYAALAELRATLAGNTKDYFQEAYGVDISEMLRPGEGTIINLARGPGAEGHTVGTNPPTLNWELICASSDRRLFEAMLLHELEHSLKNRGKLRPYTPTERVLRMANPANLKTTNRFAALAASSHRARDFFAEVIQFGEQVTYGGSR